MGVMRFTVHPADMLKDWQHALQAWFVGYDGRIHPTRVEIDENTMICRRQVFDSGKLHVRWPVEGFGSPVLSTASLREREAPYLLAVELARGKIGQIRNQVGAWEISGMSIPNEFREPHREAHRLFRQAAIRHDDPAEASRLAGTAIGKACEAAEILTRAYTEQRLAVRHSRSLNLPISVGCDLSGSAPKPEWNETFRSAFSAALVPIEWRHVEPVEGEYHWELYDRQVEWCQDNKLLTMGGPLLDLSLGGMPEWLTTWSKDFLNLLSFVSDFVETAVSRYVGRIRHWEIAARGNTGGALGLSEENRIALVARMLETARRIDDEILLTVRIDQPWGDYMAHGHHRLSPLQFVDALVRSRVGLSEVNLEIAVGYETGCAAPRELLDFSRMLDQWSSLGVQLNVTLAVPSMPSPPADPDATLDEEELRVEPSFWKSPVSEQSQAEWIDTYLPLLMAKESIVGVYWPHFTDGAPHRFPSAGVIRPDGSTKPVLDQIVRYRKAYWRSNR